MSTRAWRWSPRPAIRCSASAQEQASGLQQVNKAVVDMDSMTQQNAAMVEESSGASREMHTQSVRLSALIGRFQIGGPAAPAARDQRPRPSKAPAQRAAAGGARGLQQALAQESWKEF